MPSQPNVPDILPPRAALGGLLGNVDRLSNLLQNLANPAPSQTLERVASPRLIIENPPDNMQPVQRQAPPTEIEQIRQSIQERSSQLQQNISENEQSLQDIIEGRGNNRQSHNQAAEGDLNVVEEIEEALGSEGNINPPQFIGAPQQDQAAGVHQPASLPIQQPNISLEDVSAFEQEDSHHELPVVPQQPPQVEEVVQQLENIRIPEEEKKEEQPAQASGGRTFGYDNQYLIDNGIDPAILQELPEELRAELLSTIDIPPDFQPDQQQQQQLADNVPQNIEAPAQQQPAQPVAQPQPQQPEYYAIAQALGLDPEFLANLPEDMRMELIEQAQAQQAPPQRQPEQMDVASFVATVTDVNLRREIFMGMDEATIASLPPNLMAEARNVQNYIRQDRDRRQREALDRERQRLVDMAQQQPRGHFGRMEDIFGGHRHRGEQREANQRREKTLDEIVNLRNAQIADEISTDDIVLSINMQIINNEKIIEALLLILLTNDKAKCDLIPCLQALTKLQNQSGVPVIRNKVVNAITFLLKAIATNDVESLKLFLPNHDVKQKKSVLLLIGSLRLLLKSSKSLMKFILKGLVQRDDQGAGKAISSQILKKQFKALTLKSPIQASETTETGVTVETIIQTSPQKQQQKQVTPPSSLTEILSLIKTDYFKQDKMMLRNLSLLIQEILKKFDVAIEELESSNNSISAETIQSIADVLSLDTIDKNLLEALSDFFYQISLKKEENFKLVRDFCACKSSFLLDKLNGRLLEISMVFQGAQKLTATRTLSMIDQRALSHNSALEEEKSDSMMIDGGMLALVATTSQKATVKLCEDDEKQLKQMMRISEDSDILFRIFKLLNHFYDKNSQVEQQQKEQQRLVDTTEQSRKVEQITRFVRDAYENKSISDFASNVSEVLKIVQKTNFEVNESISNLIFCVFSAYYPELIDAIEHQRVQQIEEEKRKEQEPKEKTNKYQIKMLPLTEATVKATKEKFTLFKDCNYTSLRVEELSNFCMVNKRIINKMIKSRSHMFANELEGLIKHMPNILDFDNKRAHFKKELTKLKRNGYGGQIQLFIRRDDIFRDTYGQLKDKQADELKGRLHISFTGERGQDAGGLTRDFFIELSRAMFNPNYSLFVASSSGSSYYPNPKSYIESQHLQYFKFIGRIVGKAIFDECLLECYFVKSLYKIMTGEPLSITDLEDFDNAYYNNLKWCLENDVSILETTMSLEQDYFGKTEEIELVPNGKNIPLTNENKWDYVEKVSKYRLYGAIQKQIDAFLEGFHELIPKELVSIFNFKELELLISGLPHFDLEDLKANTEFSGYSHSSPQVQWLWEVLEVFESAERAEFLQFVTGSSKVPVEGFKGLIGMRGPQKFTIAKIKTDDIMRLPSGHTCFNQLDLPEYPSKELLHERLLIAIKETKGFGFA
ncbi:hypothetical protein FGO68_gene5813 [Halteria grandinella]|uniref:HECT-type E3 ubiquitin transferase n=1 Tax=Halteria grandinella TaxID=5974 RepID=A0A8J8SY48_HALGN|nr:hypothetical protein FGO68_gene5813 [Halteria grandinella]